MPEPVREWVVGRLSQDVVVDGARATVVVVTGRRAGHAEHREIQVVGDAVSQVRGLRCGVGVEVEVRPTGRAGRLVAHRIYTERPMRASLPS